MSDSVETVEVVVVNYDAVCYKPAEALEKGAEAATRRLTSAADRGETIEELPMKEYKRLSSLDPPAVARPGKEAAAAEAAAEPEVELTKPNAEPVEEPTDDSTETTETTETSTEPSPPASSDSLSPEAKAMNDAGTVPTLTKLAQSKAYKDKVTIESGDKKADLARKLADAGATPDQIKK